MFLRIILNRPDWTKSNKPFTLPPPPKKTVIWENNVQYINMKIDLQL